MNMLNALVKELVPFAAQHNLDLLQILFAIDIVLCNSSVNSNDEEEVNSFIDTILYLNALLTLFNVPSDWSDHPDTPKIFDTTLINRCREKTASIPRFQQLRLNVYKDNNPSIVSTTNSFLSKD